MLMTLTGADHRG